MDGYTDGHGNGNSVSLIDTSILSSIETSVENKANEDIASLTESSFTSISESTNLENSLTVRNDKETYCSNLYKTLFNKKSTETEAEPLSITVKALFGYAKQDEVLNEPVKRKRMIHRRRLNTRPIDDCSSPEKYDVANFVPGYGLVNGWFWHTYYDGYDGAILEERAILFQAMEHYETIQNDPTFGHYLKDEDPMTLPTFGEQVIVKGCDASQLAVGDVFAVQGGVSTLILEITSPRRPMYTIDLRHGSPRGLKGMKRYTMTNSLGGWFTRVLVAGELRDDMTLVRTKRPNPKYTLTYLSKVLYSEGNSTQLARCLPHWERSKQELIDLTEIPQLARYQWRTEALKILDKIKHQEQRIMEQQKHFSLYSFHKSLLQQINFFIGTNQHPTLLIKGLYGRVPNEGTDSKKKKMMRRRLRTRPLDDLSSSTKDDDYETAMFVPCRGLVGQWFYHDWYEGGIMEDRAMLFQSMENYNVISKHKTFGKFVDNENIINSPTFGEQVLVEGCNTFELAVGDLFVVDGSKLVVEITSPRLPCCAVDFRHGSPKGMKGMKRYTMTNALAGWFTRVIQSGELREGMRFVRIKHPNPKWTLNYLCKVLYSEGNKRQMFMAKPHWVRSKKELIQLTKIPQLARYEWKVEAEKLLLAMDD